MSSRSRFIKLCFRGFKQEFAAWLLSVGDGRDYERAGGVEHSIKLPQHMHITGTPEQRLENLIAASYPDISDPHPKPPEYLTARTILSTHNETVDEINHLLLSRFPGQVVRFSAFDKVVHETPEQTYEEDVNAGYSAEYLQQLTPNGFPKANLEVKVGCPIMLLCNLDPAQGLCNGTQLLITQTAPNMLEGHILGGAYDGRVAFIPRVTLHARKTDLTFILACWQFPVHLCFSMTINKSQGQSVWYVGIDLHIPVFTHGQLYVALS